MMKFTKSCPLPSSLAHSRKPTQKLTPLHYLDCTVTSEGGATNPWPRRLPHIGARCTYGTTVTLCTMSLFLYWLDLKTSNCLLRLWPENPG